MPLNTELPPTYAIIKVKKFTLKDGKIDTVSVETSYPLLSITHKMELTRDDLVSFLRSGEQVSYKKNPWILGIGGLIDPVELFNAPGSDKQDH